MVAPVSSRTAIYGPRRPIAKGARIVLESPVAWKVVFSPVYAASPLWFARASESATCPRMSTMVLTKPLSVSSALFALAAAVLGGCSGASGTMVQFRDLADIPERPGVTARGVNEQVEQALKEDRARTVQAAESLRSEPFSPPEPAPPPRPDPEP